MEDSICGTLDETILQISSNLDASPDGWRHHLATVRHTTEHTEFLDLSPDEHRRQSQIRVISTFQRVAFADADNQIVRDVADWCLRQALSMLQLYPDDPQLLALVGQSWLSRAQRFLANISRAERWSSSSSGASAYDPTSTAAAVRSAAEAEQLLSTPDYVEARGFLLPATEYLQQATEAATAQATLTGELLCLAAEAHMSLGNVTCTRFNARHFRRAIVHLQAAANISGYDLPAHLERYLEDVGPLYTSSDDEPS